MVFRLTLKTAEISRFLNWESCVVKMKQDEPRLPGQGLLWVLRGKGAPLGMGLLRGTGTVAMALWGLCGSLRVLGIGNRGRRTILPRLRRG